MKASSLNNILYIIAFVGILLCSSCNTPDEKENTNGTKDRKTTSSGERAPVGKRRYVGPISNGMKGDSIFLVLSEDGKKIEDLTFKGYWRCSGKLEQTTAGPEGTFDVKNGIVNGILVEPPDGGATAWRFELQATIDEAKASGTFRMNINNLGCDTYKLNFTAVAK